MKKSALLISVFSLIGFVSCDRAETEVIRSYVVSYTDIDSIYLELTDSTNIRIYANSRYVASWKSEGRSKEIYDSLCMRHNDMNYYKKTSYIMHPLGRSYFKGDISKISIISNAAFDLSHPAGESLNDRVRFISVSAVPFIRSGYKQTYNWGKNLPMNFKREFYSLSFYEDSHHFPVDKMLSELTPEDFNLTGFGEPYTIGYLIVESHPTLSKTHIFTVTVKTTDGRVFSKSIRKIFK